MVEFKRRRRIEIPLNLTPLIDAVLQLLIFFMLSSRFVSQTGIKVSLPTATIKEVHPLISTKVIE